VAADGGDGTPDPLERQLPVIRAVLDAVGVCHIGAGAYEADDVLGTLVAAATVPVWVVTGDRDLFQLVRDLPTPVRVVYTVERMRLYGPAEVAARFGIPGEAYADYALLRGDPSDGLPGVPGIGEKTAAALVTRFGSIEGIRAALATGLADGFPAGARARLVAAEDYLAAAEPVVRVAGDVPLPDFDPAVPTAPTNPAALVELADRWGLDGAVERLLRALEVVRGGG
jgi:5'-3' exonuclease